MLEVEDEAEGVETLRPKRPHSSCAAKRRADPGLAAAEKECRRASDKYRAVRKRSDRKQFKKRGKRAQQSKRAAERKK